MKLVVGLGNPGRKYQGTRHNIGFEIVGRLIEQYATSKPRTRFRGELTEVRVDGIQTLLLRPSTFMNLSGSSVQPACDYYQIAPLDLLVVCDDFHLELGRIRFRRAGSSGGQKGLDDIIQRLGIQEIPRLRIGIGPVPEKWDPADFVLGRFASKETESLEQVMTRASEGVVTWVTKDIEHCMNEYNG